MQNASKILMIRPSNFSYNAETAENNRFQTKNLEMSQDDIRKLALIEFDNMVEALRSSGVEVLVIEDTESPVKPDAVFPNNWISTHSDNSIITYPMYAESRRSERREDIIEKLEEVYGFEKRYSFEHYEEEDKFLEGTGSMILDRKNRIAYACKSPRTHVRLLNHFGILKSYKTVLFSATDDDGAEIYHTNVMMSVGDEIAVVCLESVRDKDERKKLEETLRKSGKEIITISISQMNAFAGNMLEVKNEAGENIMVMSDTAFRSLKQDQINKITEYSSILNVDIKTIEKYGGGSARCMMAEIFS